MMLKQNIRPQKQGQFFRLNLYSNIDDGPFLKKDIMQSNNRSIALLSGKGVLQNISHYNKSMVIIQNQTKQLSLLVPECEDNITKTIKFFQSQIVQVQRQSKKLKKQERKLKKQMQQIFEKQKQNQKQLYEQCVPLLRRLFKTVRQNNSKQKQQFHQIDKTLEEIQLTKKVIVEGMILCQRKIMKLQDIVGYKTLGNSHDEFQLSRCI